MSVPPLFAPGLPLVHGPDWTGRLADWCARRIPHVGLGEDGHHRFGPCWAVGVMRPGRGDDPPRLAGVVVAHDFDAIYGTIQYSVAAAKPGVARWATPEVMGAVLGVAFTGRLGAPVRKVWAMVPSTNPHVVRFNEHLGFKREAVLREQFAPRVHGVVCGMMRKEWERRYASSKTSNMGETSGAFGSAETPTFRPTGP